MRNKELAAILAAGLVLGNWGAAEAAAPEAAAASQIGQITGAPQRRHAQNQAYHETENRVQQEQQKSTAKIQ